MMKRYLMIFSYDGTNYHGYQKQGSYLTIQGELERVLTKINNNRKVVVTASGRTDRGVHALNQKAHFDLDMNITCLKLKQALNTYTNSDIYIKEVTEVSTDFHARYNVKRKEYIYKMNIGEYNPIERNIIYQYNKPLNIRLMKQALSYFKGEHDFTSFASQEDLKEDCVRKIIKTSIKKQDDIITISFLGNGFLKYQVRNMVGALIDVGNLKREPKSIKDSLEKKNRVKASKTVNPEGLYLSNVWY